MESRGRSEQDLTFHFRENATKIGSLEIPLPLHVCLEVDRSSPLAQHLLAGVDFPRHFQETGQKRPLKKMENWPLNSLAKAVLARSPNLLGFSQEIKMQEIKASAQGHGHNGASPALEFQAVAEKPGISPPNLNIISPTARQPPPSCGQK